MNKLLLLCFSALLLSCGNTESTETDTTDSIDTSEVVETIADTFPIIDTILTTSDTLVQDTIIYSMDDEMALLFSDSIAPYVSVVQMEEMKNAYFFSQGIRTSQDLYDYYTIRLPKVQSAVLDGMQKSHPDVIYSGDQEPAEHWSFISTLFPELDAECLCSECSSEAHIRIDKMQELAKKTPGTEDDDYFFFAAMVYGPGWDGIDEDIEEQDVAYFNQIYDIHNPGWFVVDHCDICGYNTLGNDFYYKTLEFAFNKKWNLYQSNVDRIIGWGELGDHQYNFYYEKEAVLKELENIKILPLPDEYMNGIKMVIKRINENNEVHFGCQDINNDCPVG